MYETKITKEQALAILQGGDPILVTAPYMDEIVETVISLDDLGRDMEIDWETITQEEQDELVQEHFELMLERFENFYREKLDPATFEFFANAETVVPEHRYLVEETGSPDGTIWTEVYETLPEARKAAAGAEYINRRDKINREIKVLYVEKSEKYYMPEDLEQDPFDWIGWFCADEVEDKPDLQISLAAARVNAGLTQKEAGDLIGVTELTVRNWELGNYKPAPERHRKIEDAYGISIANIKI